jgi:hypothetical protein
MKRLIVTLALLFCASPAYASDFTLTVPVSLNNLPPNIHSVWVTCQVFEAIHLHVTGVASREIPITGGAFRADVVLEINAVPDRDPANAVEYRCVAWLKGSSATNPDQAYFEDGDISAAYTFPLAAGAPFLMDTGFVRLR